MITISRATAKGSNARRWVAGLTTEERRAIILGAVVVVRHERGPWRRAARVRSRWVHEPLSREQLDELSAVLGIDASLY